ncbi:peptide deformylase [Bacillus sonorensis]|uniref:peptide deformylase n=1 Tax=Bacillus sonorensis TaxID=119858 RepID=UPI001B284D51|nr:peptide deformylase [Bacillus sonorensis]GIN65826.1 hypothetical protein J41TS2_12470 [Bacillus sonorensis]
MSKFHSDDLIIKEGHEILRKATADVSLPPTVEAKEELSAMLRFLQNSQDPQTAKTYRHRPGVGLSANQICLEKRLFASHFTDEENRQRGLHALKPNIIAIPSA